MLDKCSSRFRRDDSNVFLGHCAISPLFAGAREAINRFAEQMSAGGVAALPEFFDVMPKFHRAVGRMLRTGPENISFVQNTATAMSMIAGGYPFDHGDQIISYVHEYPSNHYPWVMQRMRGVELVLLPDTGEAEGGNVIRGWSMKDLEQLVTPRTRIIAISHVQFASGFAADLELLGSFCKEKGIDLVVDCAQSLGCLPVYPEEYGVAALASSGWKWLMGPFGAGVMYTNEEFRSKLQPTMAGPAMMRQGLDYLDHSWNPHEDGRKFEFSAAPWDHVAALERVISELFVENDMEEVRDEIFRLQDVFLEHLDTPAVMSLLPHKMNRSGIIPLQVSQEPQEVIAAMQREGVVITGPTGVLRLAPHFYMEDAEMVMAAEVMNSVLKK